MQAWKRICEASRKEFELIYNRLGVTIQERGESFYNPFLGPLVTELLASGIAEESEGAKVRPSYPISLKGVSRSAETLCSIGNCTPLHDGLGLIFLIYPLAAHELCKCAQDLQS